MQYILHKADSRGSADFGWLKAKYTFSFANYYRPDRIHFGTLRVLNDDKVAPKSGFDMHPHDNMEIITIPLQGEITHRDTMGFSETIRTGEIQVMSAGSGIYHSEHNHHPETELQLLQIWVFPNKKNVEPRYDTIKFDRNAFTNRLQQLISPDPTDEGSWIHQDAWFYMGSFETGKKIDYTFRKSENGLYIFVIDGRVQINEIQLESRDGIGIKESNSLTINILRNTQILLMEVPV